MQRPRNARHGIVALLIMAPGRWKPFQADIAKWVSELRKVSTVSAAKGVLGDSAAIDIVFTDTTLPDGDWTNVLTAVAESGRQAPVLVCLEDDQPATDRLVAERGGYRARLRPYHPASVHLIVLSALARVANQNQTVSGRPIA